MRLSLLSWCLMMLTACGDRVPPIPESARTQVPAEAGPSRPWQGQGRLEISWPGSFRSGDAYLRRLEDGRIRLTAVADGGVTLIDLITGDPVEVISGLAELRDHAGQLAALAAVWSDPPAEEAEWTGAVRRRGRMPTRWYGGDPVLLRRIEGDGWPIQVGDYRQIPQGLMAFRAEALGSFAASVSLRLTSVVSP